MAQGRWELVARTVRDRRLALGLRQSDTPGVSAASWRNLESARQTSYRPYLLRRVEAALGWPPGTIDEIVAGTRDEPSGAESPTRSLDDRIDLLHARFDRIERSIDQLLRRLTD